MGLAPPGAHTPNWNGCGVAAKPRAWSELNPSWPVSATANAHPEPGVPNVDSGTIRVAVRLVLSGANCALPSEALEGPTQTGGAKPWASSRSLHAGATP